MSLMFLFKLLLFIHIVVGQDDEIVKTIERSHSISCDHDRNLQLNTHAVKIHFYDFQTNLHGVYEIDEAFHGITSNKLDYTKRLVFFLPGYKSEVDGETSEWIRDAFRNISDAYLIIFDFSAYTSHAEPIPFKTYKISVIYAYYIGARVGKLLSRLRDEGFSAENIHGIGHSFGGQILGYVGDTFYDKPHAKIGRLTAIDPAGLCFDNAATEDHIRSGVADYVEIYHCNAAVFGSSRIYGDADIFFGNGNIQPGCEESSGYRSMKSMTCSHVTCVKYWAWTVGKTGYRAVACKSYGALESEECTNNTTIVVGYSSPPNTTGVFYIPKEQYETI